MTGLKPCEGSETYARIVHQVWRRYSGHDPYILEKKVGAIGCSNDAAHTEASHPHIDEPTKTVKEAVCVRVNSMVFANVDAVR